MISSSTYSSLSHTSVIVLVLFMLGCEQPATNTATTAEVPLALQPSRPILSLQPIVGHEIGATAELTTVDVVYPGEIFLPWGDGVGELGLLPPAEERRPEGPCALAVAPDGTLWVLDQVNWRLVHLSPSGDWIGELVAPPGASDLYVGPDGNLFVMSLVNHRVTIIDSEDEREHVPIPMAFRTIARIFVDSRGHLLVVNSHENSYDLGMPGAWIPWPDLLHTAREGVPGVSEGRRYQPILIDDQAALLHQPSQDEPPETWNLPDTQNVRSIVILDSKPDGSALVLLETDSDDGVVRTVRLVDPNQGNVAQLTLPRHPYTPPFRELAVGRDGVIHQLYSRVDGVTIFNHQLRRVQ